MGRRRKYFIGQEIFGHRIIQEATTVGAYVFECSNCRKTKIFQPANLKWHRCPCQKTESESRCRYSGSNYAVSPRRLEELKAKYKNGVTEEILSEFISSL